jgi:hypothetical protein
MVLDFVSAQTPKLPHPPDLICTNPHEEIAASGLPHDQSAQIDMLSKSADDIMRRPCRDAGANMQDYR